MNKLICSVFRSPRKEGMYLYVEKSQQLQKVPQTLLDMFGAPEYAMTLLLTPQRKLAQADASKVMEQISSKGFYLQMPPSQEEYMRAINVHNSKLSAQ